MMKFNLKNRAASKEGFSLVELLVVVVIIGILAVFAVPRYLETIKNAQASKQKAVIAAVEKAKDQLILSQYQTGNGVINPGAWNALPDYAKLSSLGRFLARNGMVPTTTDLVRGTGKSSITMGTLLNAGTGTTTPRTTAAFGG